MMVDDAAVRVATERFGLPPCLHVPIAAIDEASVGAYVGVTSRALSSGSATMALLVEVTGPSNVDTRLPIWSLPESAVLHAPRQLWVHVDWRQYRSGFRAAFPNQDLRSLVVDHVMNRRVARLKGFQFVRVIAISRQANSRPLSERWSVEYFGSAAMRSRNAANPAKIQYADLADIVKMLNREIGKQSLQDSLIEAQALVR